MKNALFTAATVGLFLILNPLSWAAETTGPRVVVSIKPIHALVAGVMQGVAEPRLLIQGGGSPHGYVLRPSEAHALANADLVVWVSPQLESFLVKPLDTLGNKARQMELVETIEGPLLALREGGSWEGHDHHDDEADHHDDEADHHDDEADHHEHADGADSHIWLSPLLAKQIVASTVQALSELDPSNQQHYADNAERLLERLDTFHRELEAKLAPVKRVPYIVFHDAYQYFETTYKMNAVGSITIDPERKPGAKRISEIRAKIKSLDARCVFSEPQFEPKLVTTIIGGTGARRGNLDPLGADLPVGPESYFQLLNNLADNLLTGLRP